MFDPVNLFPFISLAFLLASALRFARNGRRWEVSIRIWLTMAAIFAIVAVWIRFLR
ncbi:MAG: hypothetical protein NFW17_14690 [Candidatus Accumulibacter sp.]|uniref:hypothetical protein n=1 Tax=Accumulibacter sp. TaxID=2053492 RepID=UPI0025E35141|nr:hypothetical protein [Accumulibacter sp.]MCM8613306.1 hypothetical protein [Accumulibacter sp.]MCM8640864.1 hypothetical protein [Accumulibacter sp.]